MFHVVFGIDFEHWLGSEWQHPVTMQQSGRPDELDRGGYCYAESWDGIHWEKPPLDLFSFRGSQRNNQFYL